MVYKITKIHTSTSTLESLAESDGIESIQHLTQQISNEDTRNTIYKKRELWLKRSKKYISQLQP